MASYGAVCFDPLRYGRSGMMCCDELRIVQVRYGERGMLRRAEVRSVRVRYGRHGEVSSVEAK